MSGVTVKLSKETTYLRVVLNKELYGMGPQDIYYGQKETYRLCMEDSEAAQFIL
jgi:hypothetical protein